MVSATLWKLMPFFTSFPFASWMCPNICTFAYVFSTYFAIVFTPTWLYPFSTIALSNI